MVFPAHFLRKRVDPVGEWDGSGDTAGGAAPPACRAPGADRLSLELTQVFAGGVR